MTHPGGNTEENPVFKAVISTDRFSTQTLPLELRTEGRSSSNSNDRSLLVPVLVNLYVTLVIFTSGTIFPLSSPLLSVSHTPTHTPHLYSHTRCLFSSPGRHSPHILHRLHCRYTNSVNLGPEDCSTDCTDKILRNTKKRERLTPCCWIIWHLSPTASPLSSTHIWQSRPRVPSVMCHCFSVYWETITISSVCLVI